MMTLLGTPESDSADPLPDSFDTDGAADYIGCSPGYLIKLRGEGSGPKFHRLFKRKGIKYRRVDIDAWAAARRYGSTSEYPEAFR